MNCSFCAAAGVASATPASTACASISLLRAISTSSSARLCGAGSCFLRASFLLLPTTAAPRCDLRLLSRRRPSVGKRPKSELLFANRDKPGKATWLLDEKKADQRSKEDEFEVSDRFC